MFSKTTGTTLKSFAEVLFAIDIIGIIAACIYFFVHGLVAAGILTLIFGLLSSWAVCAVIYVTGDTNERMINGNKDDENEEDDVNNDDDVPKGNVRIKMPDDERIENITIRYNGTEVWSGKHGDVAVFYIAKADSVFVDFGTDEVMKLYSEIEIDHTYLCVADDVDGNSYALVDAVDEMD